MKYIFVYVYIKLKRIRGWKDLKFKKWKIKKNKNIQDWKINKKMWWCEKWWTVILCDFWNVGGWEIVVHDLGWWDMHLGEGLLNSMNE